MEECNTPAVGDVEEGEISDSASVEEISEDAFNKQQDPPTSTTVTTTATTKVVNSNNQNQNSSTRVWTMRDVYKYPISRDYARGLYNLAWAQAVQNKPLNELFVMTTDDNSKQSVESSSDMVEKVIIHVDDDTMEEGELEEGEIDSDADVVVVNGGATNNDDELNSFKTSKEEANLIREQLLSVTVDEMEK